MVALGEVPSYFARSHEVRQQAEIPRLVSDAPSDNRRVNAKPLRQLHHREWGRMVLHSARLPHGIWNERLFSPFVRFVFFGVPAHAFDIAQTQVVDERLVVLAVHVTADMREFMQQTEPEIIEPVIAQRQADNRRAVSKLQRRAIEMRARQVLDAKEMDTVLRQEFCASRGPSSDQLSLATFRRNSRSTVPDL